MRISWKQTVFLGALPILLAACGASSGTGTGGVSGSGTGGSATGGSGVGGSSTGTGGSGSGGSGTGGSGAAGHLGTGGTGGAGAAGHIGTGGHGGATSTGGTTGTGGTISTGGVTGAGGSLGGRPGTGSGKTYYVDPSGNDSNAGTATSPWKTIQHAGGHLAAGDTVIVRAGTYDGAIFCWDAPPCGTDVYCLSPGTSGNPITFEADPQAAAGSVIIASKNDKNAIGLDLEPGCDYINVVGFTVTNAGTSGKAAGSITKAGIGVEGNKGNQIFGNTVNGVSGIGGIFVDAVTNVVVKGNTVLNTQGSGTTGHGMYVSGSSVGVQVVNNSIHDNAYVGIHINGDVSEGTPGVVSGITIAGNLIHDNGQNGINADGLQSSTIVNNVIYHNDRNGIELYQIDALGGSTKNCIVNNSIDQSSGSSYAIEITACAYDNQSSAPTPAGCSSGAMDTSTGNVAFNNVLLGGGGVSSTVSASDLALSTNITTASSRTTVFVGASSGNYALASGGPGIGSGVASFQGCTAPQDGSGYDTGAFSFGLP